MGMRLIHQRLVALLVLGACIQNADGRQQDNPPRQDSPIATSAPQATQEPKPVPAVGQTASQVGIQPRQDVTEKTVILRLDAGPEKGSWSETLKAIAELLAASAWPIVFMIFILTQRRQLAGVLRSVEDVIGKSTHVKLWELIDVEVDRSAKQAAENPVPEREVSPQEREAATRLGKLVGGVELTGVRQRMIEFAHEYEATRSNLKPGPARTRAMNAIVAKMRTLAIAARPFFSEFAQTQESPGNHLAAIAMLQLSPSLEYVPWLVERMSKEQPFVFYQASLALLAAARALGSRNSDDLKTALERARNIVTSFKGGPPDRNTIEILSQALSELALSGESQSSLT